MSKTRGWRLSLCGTWSVETSVEKIAKEAFHTAPLSKEATGWARVRGNARKNVPAFVRTFGPKGASFVFLWALKAGFSHDIVSHKHNNKSPARTYFISADFTQPAFRLSCDVIPPAKKTGLSHPKSDPFGSQRKVDVWRLRPRPFACPRRPAPRTVLTGLGKVTPACIPRNGSLQEYGEDKTHFADKTHNVSKCRTFLSRDRPTPLRSSPIGENHPRL